MLIKAFFKWMFDTPTPIITVISVLIAYIAYRFQRALKRKHKALELAQQYSDKFIPRMRYIKLILNEIGAKQYINQFNGYTQFTEKELSDFLKKESADTLQYKNLFKKVDESILNKAYSESGCNTYISNIHKNLIDAFHIEKDSIDTAIYKFILDFLNDVESLASNFYYNIAEEQLVYPILHQTFLSNMDEWYFFIADRNQLDHDRFFICTIWLYDLWNQRKQDNCKKLRDKFAKENKRKRLH